jgi:hypothetical protein
VICEEIEPWEENHQKWRVLRATFDPSIDTYFAVQKFYFDDRGMLQRHDYFTDVAKGNVAHLFSRRADGWFHVGTASSPRQVAPRVS